MFDAYSVRKAIPRILIAAIGINISIYLCIAAVDIVNVVSGGIARLIAAPFTVAEFNEYRIPLDDASGAVVGGVGVVVGSAAMIGAVSAIITALGAAGGAAAATGLVLSTASGALASLFFILIPIVVLVLAILCVVVLRQALLFFLIVISPVAIAMFVLPGTEKYFQKWWDLFSKTLLVYPIIAVMFAISDVFASIILKNANGPDIPVIVTGIIVMYAPLFLIPFAFKLAGGAIAAIASFANNQNARIGKRYQDWRSNPNTFAGKQQMRFRDNRRQLGLTGSQVASGTVRGFRNASRGKSYTSGYRDAVGAIGTEKSLIRGEEIGKHEAVQAIKGNDDYLYALKDYTSDESRVKYLMGKGYSQTDAEKGAAAIKRAEAVGSRNELERFAAVQLAGTGTAYAGGAYEMNEAIIAAAKGDSVLEGNMMAAARANAQSARRQDLVSGFGTNMKALNAQKNGASVAEINQMVTDNVLETQAPGAILGQRSNAVANLIPAMQRRILDSQKKLKDKIAAGGGAPTQQQQAEIDDALRTYKQMIASTAGLYDSASQLAPENARLLANSLMSVELVHPETNQTQSIHQIIESLRGDNHFQEMRREYQGQAAQQYAAAQAQAQAQAQAAQPPPGSPPPPGAIGGGNSDRRIKYEIVDLYHLENGFKLYKFKYLWSNIEYVGVMAQDVQQIYPNAVTKTISGYLRVDYDMLGLRMITYEEYKINRKLVSIDYATSFYRNTNTKYKVM